eukprot:c24675_g1_i1 orf=104-1750(+)
MAQLSTSMGQLWACIVRLGTGVALVVIISLLCTKAIAASTLGLARCLDGAGITNFITLDNNQETYHQLLDFSLQNLRFAGGDVPKPVALILPESKEQIQKALQCSRSEKLELRVRSGGHSFEGFSYVAETPFVILDLMKWNRVDVDLDTKTAWVESGATLGEIYYGISQKTSEYGFSAGWYPTVGSGGHFSGGGYGMLSRKYGVSADLVIDAEIVDAEGNLLDRQTMGEDLFWALRGGGGGSWGIVVAWKIKLVPIPPTITVFNLQIADEMQVTDLFYKWQTIAASAPDELSMTVVIKAMNLTETGSSDQTGSSNVRTEIVASFLGQYLGPPKETLTLVNNIFRELPLTANDCREVKWIESIFIFSQLPNNRGISALADRLNFLKFPFKSKSDYVTTPIPKTALAGAFALLKKYCPTTFLEFLPQGGIMDRIAPDSIAFPHRAGNLYLIMYVTPWSESEEGSYYLAGLERLYNFMTPHVSKNPRSAYVNSVDLDLGSRRAAIEPNSWGEMYFSQNFARLVEIKSKFDPDNVFNHPQSIPVLSERVAIE